jgi:hypothetical protein
MRCIQWTICLLALKITNHFAETPLRWVLAVDMYEKIAKTIAPKREALQKAESDYQVNLSLHSSLL